MVSHGWLSAEQERDVSFSVVHLRADLGRALKLLVEDGSISGHDLLATYLWADDWTYREIAARLGCSLGEAHNAVQRVLDAIRESGLMQGYE